MPRLPDDMMKAAGGRCCDAKKWAHTLYGAVLRSCVGIFCGVGRDVFFSRVAWGQGGGYAITPTAHTLTLENTLTGRVDDARSSAAQRTNCSPNSADIAVAAAGVVFTESQTKRN